MDDCPYKTRYGRIVKCPKRYVDEFEKGDSSVMQDDYALDEHDLEYIDRTFNDKRRYKKYMYDHNDSGSDEDCDSVVSAVSEKLSNMSLQGGGGESDAESDDSYESSFVSRDMDERDYDNDSDY